MPAVPWLLSPRSDKTTLKRNIRLVSFDRFSERVYLFASETLRSKTSCDALLSDGIHECMESSLESSSDASWDACIAQKMYLDVHRYSIAFLVSVRLHCMALLPWGWAYGRF
jgi:hypothetical protein